MHLRVVLNDRFVEFGHDIASEYRWLRVGVTLFLAQFSAGSITIAPMIYSLISFCRAVCFRAYDIPRVSRREHIVFDRSKLGYLNWISSSPSSRPIGVTMIG